MEVMARVKLADYKTPSCDLQLPPMDCLSRSPCQSVSWTNPSTCACATARVYITHHRSKKKLGGIARQLRVGAMVPTEQRRPDLRITGEGQSGAPPWGGSTQNRS